MFPSDVGPVPRDQVMSDRPGGWGTLGGQQGAGSGNTASVMKDAIVPSGSPT